MGDPLGAVSENTGNGRITMAQGRTAVLELARIAGKTEMWLFDSEFGQWLSPLETWELPEDSKNWNLVWELWPRSELLERAVYDAETALDRLEHVLARIARSQNHAG
jgi:hypothetical protein